jgi:ribosome recycling factor
MSNLKELETRMENSLTALNKDFGTLRTGRASPSLLDGIMVDAYGSMMPLSQVGTVSAPEPRTISVQVWDKGMIGAVEKAIMTSNLGLNPSSDGQLVRIPMPDLTEERRKEMVKIASSHAEKAKISIRNIRRDGNDDAKKAEKDGDISQDEMHALTDNIQKLTDDSVKRIDSALADKEKDILTV